MNAFKLFCFALFIGFAGTAGAGTPAGVCKAPVDGTIAGVCWAPAPAPISVALPPAEALTAGDQVTLEAAWAAADIKAQRVARDLADEYASRMDANCVVSSFDFSPAIQVYTVYTPPGAEAMRNRLVAEMTRRLVCPNPGEAT